MKYPDGTESLAVKTGKKEKGVKYIEFYKLIQECQKNTKCDGIIINPESDNSLFVPLTLLKSGISAGERFSFEEARTRDWEEVFFEEGDANMPEENSKICCMFDDVNPSNAVAHKDLERIATLFKSSRSREVLYRCRRCGAYVFYEYEEIANLNGSWDNADVFEHFYPVEVEEDSPGSEESYKWSRIAGAKWIYGHNLEEDKNPSYIYKE